MALWEKGQAEGIDESNEDKSDKVPPTQGLAKDKMEWQNRLAPA